MKDTRILMDMPVVVEIVDQNASWASIEKIYRFFHYIDDKFSLYKTDSEISQINRGEIKSSNYSQDMKTIFKLAAETKIESHGYFDINHQGIIDPSGIVKGWAIHQAALLLTKDGYRNFYIDAGGDIEVSGHNSQSQPWVIGIRNPFNRFENVKIIQLKNQGVATSGTYIRGQHIYNPQSSQPITDVISLTVIGPDVYQADRFSTPAFAMGRQGIYFIEKLPGFEGYQIDHQGQATFTSGWHHYVVEN